MPYVIGLTGNIACGKSTVAAMLADLGAEIIDADRVAHQVMTPGGPVFAALVREFGPTIVATDGTIDRQRLGSIVFRDPTALRRLDALVHPHTGAEIRRLIEASSAKVVVVEAIKLIESGTYRRCDSVWLVTCPSEKQVERLMARSGLSYEEAERRVRAQAPAEEKRPYADVVVDTSGAVEHTREQVRAAWQRLGPGTS